MDNGESLTKHLPSPFENMVWLYILHEGVCNQCQISVLKDIRRLRKRNTPRWSRYQTTEINNIHCLSTSALASVREWGDPNQVDIAISRDPSIFLD